MKFGGEEGMIIEFHNDTKPAKLVKGLCVSWICRYMGEDERYRHYVVNMEKIMWFFLDGLYISGCCCDFFLNFGETLLEI